ncbi:L-2-hydroxyglutarate oxidase [Pelovirga terrestris]|uniref:L-2-hydroxyglutarate oxidase n=1 Tax=Pelovirga terrestris TaxID=2771352 RepID=A0A8J6R6K5_9BACT|nr:L-2-hydroxyglutarate oxidase [Pelovirga terrestris]MBD1401499.1 L-2-hydroxyglutarate oxidase [Pelovirga terrestris]
MAQYDFIVIGGGIIGLATARQLQQDHPGSTIAVLEKESRLALHQTGRNSGVIHAGVYYTPGSLKAKFCREGNLATKEFCREHKIPFRETGKLLVATTHAELGRMQDLLERCRQNDIPTEVLNQQQLQEKEPNVVGLGATWVPSTGIVDYARITHQLAALFTSAGGEIHTNCQVIGIRENQGVEITSSIGRFSAQFVVGCAGLHSDRLIRMLGKEPEFRILPFRGEYFQLPVDKRRIVSHPIYPIPNPELPFLGIHLTPMSDGSLTVGPNATLALAREGYSRWSMNLRDLIDMFSYAGLYRLIGTYPGPTLSELKNSLYRPGYLKLAQRYCPQIELKDLCPYPSGVRAQAVRADGKTLDDFLFVKGEHSLIVGNAPSPAATSALPIARHICEQVKELLG